MNVENTNAALAQLDRVFGYEPKGRGFESLRARQKGNNNFLMKIIVSFFDTDREQRNNIFVLFSHYIVEIFSIIA